MSGGGGPVLEALGLSRIVVEFPCGLCDHPHESHSPACSQVTRIRGADDQPCPCPGFEGAWPDGTPRAIALRQLSVTEWVEVGRGEAVPLVAEETGARGAIDPEAWRWFRAIVERALVAVRVLDGSGQTRGPARPRWQACVVERPGFEVPDGSWSVPLADLDRSGLVGAAAVAVIADANKGGPFCGFYRGRLPSGAPAAGGVAPPDGEGVRLAAARAGSGPEGSAG